MIVTDLLVQDIRDMKTNLFLQDTKIKDQKSQYISITHID